MTHRSENELQIAEIELFFAKAEIACVPVRTEFVGRAADHIDAALEILARLTSSLEILVPATEDVEDVDGATMSSKTRNKAQ